nr:hypothetical protein [Limosilactobacillus mucosae]
MNQETKKELEKIARQLEEQAAADLSLANTLNRLIIQSCQQQ